MTEQKILIFGAGKIGRSFIGQIFGRHGWSVVFVDVKQALVRRLRKEGSYRVVVKGPDTQETILVEGVSAILASNERKVLDAIVDCSMMAVSVGKKALPSIAPLVAKGLQEREARHGGLSLDIILAENMRSAGPFFRERLQRHLPLAYPLDERVGLVESSIGKMVPTMHRGPLRQDPLMVYAEPYNTLILDRYGFRGDIPDFPELSLKKNMEAWVDRKAFIHNLGHATAAYAGFARYPHKTYLHEVLDDGLIRNFTREVMRESAHILSSIHPDEFSHAQLEVHIDELIARFRNRNLGDTLFRVGADLQRKLGPEDRFFAVIRAAQQRGLPYYKTLSVVALAVQFKAKDALGKAFPEDKKFHTALKADPEQVWSSVMGLSSPSDETLISFLRLFL